jgi:hypothetical protein
MGIYENRIVDDSSFSLAGTLDISERSWPGSAEGG